MLKTWFSRSPASYLFPGASAIKLAKFTGSSSRSTMRAFTTLSPIRNAKHAGDTTHRSYDPSGRTPNPDTSSKEVDPMISPSSPENVKAFDMETLRTRFRELSDRSAVAVRRRADDFTAKTSTTFSQLGSHLNRVTGYEEIEALKREVAEQEARIKTTRQTAQDARKAYDEAVVRRSNSQREVNDLLQRKQNWSNDDLDRFTAHIRQDHFYEQEEMRTKATVATADEAVDEEFSQLMKTILARYHEEQVWSDKIRSASTYGSLAALALNLVVFILAIVIVEPWKRRRLSQTFEKKIEEMNSENTAMVEARMKELEEHFVVQKQLWTGMIDTMTQKEGQTESTSHVLESAVETPAIEKLTRAAKDREIAAAFATSALMAGAIGWVARAWLGY